MRVAEGSPIGESRRDGLTSGLETVRDRLLGAPPFSTMLLSQLRRMRRARTLEAAAAHEHVDVASTQ